MSSEARLTSTLFPADDEVQELLVGPESITWRIASDARLWVVMLYPLLLQVAHEPARAGVVEKRRDVPRRAAGDRRHPAAVGRDRDLHIQAAAGESAHEAA